MLVFLVFNFSGVRFSCCFLVGDGGWDLSIRAFGAQGEDTVQTSGVSCRMDMCVKHTSSMFNESLTLRFGAAKTHVPL